jgi:molybdate transport system ATP-binding protein
MAVASLNPASATVPPVASAPNPDSRLTVAITRSHPGGFSLALKFEAGAGFMMILGPSGSGKSTLLNCLAGLLRPDSGRIAIGGAVLFDSSAASDVPVASRRVGYVFQNLALFPHLTVEQNVQYGIAKLAASEREQRTMTLLESFRVGHLRNRRPGEVSGGERQRIALARALVTDPVLLLLDEPLSALDTPVKSKILDDLRQWNSQHRIPILYVTHAPEEAFALGERVMVLEAGRIIAEGMPQQVLKSPRRETVAQIVGFENVFDAVVTAVMEAQGTMTCRLDANHLELEVPLTNAPLGAPVRVAIRAGDIMLATERPHALSARNTFPGRIIELRRAGATVIAMVDAGVTFEVHLTPHAVEELKLASGVATWLVLKTYSCSLVER